MNKLITVQTAFHLEKELVGIPSKYFVSDYENVEIKTKMESPSVVGIWRMSNAITIIGMHGVTSSKFSPDVLLVGGMLYNEGF